MPIYLLTYTWVYIFLFNAIKGTILSNQASLEK